MSKRQVIMILAVWVAIVPFLGFPSAWNKIFALVSGLLIVAIAYRMGPKVKLDIPGTMPYVEHKNNTDDQNVAR